MGEMEFLGRVLYLGSEETSLQKEKVGRESEPGVGEGLGNFTSPRASRCCLHEVSYKVFSAIWASASGFFFFFFFSCVDLADCSAEPPSCCEMDVYVCVWGSGREDKTGGSRSLGPGYPLLGTICLLVQD